MAETLSQHATLALMTQRNLHEAIATGTETPRSDPVWLNEAQTAERLNMSRKWLQSKRLKGEGVPYAKFGSSVRYALFDIMEFERKSFRMSTSDDGAGDR